MAGDERPVGGRPAVRGPGDRQAGRGGRLEPQDREDPPRPAGEEGPPGSHQPGTGVRLPPAGGAARLSAPRGEELPQAVLLQRGQPPRRRADRGRRAVRRGSRGAAPTPGATGRTPEAERAMSVLLWLARANLQAATMILCLFVARRLFGSRLPASVYCFAWVLVIVRLLLPISPESMASVQPGRELPTPSPAATDRAATAALTAGGGQPLAIPSQPAPRGGPAAGWVVGLLFAWGAGVATSLTTLALARRALVRQFARARASHDPALLGLVRQLSQEAGVRRPPRILETD